WEKEEYEVNVVVQNGVINGDSTKTVSYNEDGMFRFTSELVNPFGLVACTNNQNGVFKNNKLTVKNVSNDTICTVKLVEELTTYYNDETLIINEQSDDRNSNIKKHGKVVMEYEAMGSNNSYVFNNSGELPWASDMISIKSVEIGKIIKPISTAYWFSTYAESIEKGDFTSLDTSQVINMSYMFYNTGYNATTLDLIGLDKWDTSKVTDMSFMFSRAGYNVATWDIGGLSNWNTSNVTNMSSMFEQAGASARIWNVGDLSNWNTSSVTDMSSMFHGAGRMSLTFSLVLDNWDTSKVTNMRYMFSLAGQNTRTINLDLSGWDTSKVTDMSSMFSNAGFYATPWTVKIPSTTGTLTNTTSKWYGSSESVYATPAIGLPQHGKFEFTLS
ncbi:MAG: BspA family leucine-rich repeat surface protein, partial [bacterium]|nr:BspA family leucine-rich repeat surface protein [bacterium]